MLQFENAYFVDLEKGPVVDQLRKPMHYGDDKANRIGATVTKNGQAVALSGNCTGKAILGDDTWVLISNGVIDGNEAYIELPSACYSVEGPIHIFVNIDSDDTELTLLDLTGYVKATQTDSAIDPEHPTFSVSELEQIITTGAQDQIEAIEAAGESQISAIEDKGENVLNSIPSDYTAAIAEAENALAQAEDLFDSVMAAFVLETATGSTATIPDGADSVPVKSLIAQINPVQAGSGDPSFENIRAITGRTGCNIMVSGKNLLGGIAFANAVKAAMPNAVIGTDEKTVTFNGETNGTGKKHILRGNAFKPNTQYTAIINGSGAKNNYRWFYTDGTNDSANDVPSFGTPYVSAAGKSVASFGKIDNVTTNTVIKYDESGIFEGEITAAEYEAWNGQTFNITFPVEAGTVYGGTLDVANGILTVDKVKKQVLSVNLKEARYAICYIGDPGSAISSSRYRPNNTYCNLLKEYVGTVSAISNYSYTVYESTVRQHSCIGIRFEDGYTLADYNNKLSELNDAGTPLEVVYQLAEPLAVYHLSPVEVSTLLGINNIWADTGDVSVEYRADTKTYIDNQIAALQATILENISNA